ncbi:unnamed protein product, partial [Mesorhabditis spiculigera]
MASRAILHRVVLLGGHLLRLVLHDSCNMGTIIIRSSDSLCWHCLILDLCFGKMSRRLKMGPHFSCQHFPHRSVSRAKCQCLTSNRPFLKFI